MIRLPDPALRVVPLRTTAYCPCGRPTLGVKPGAAHITRQVRFTHAEGECFWYETYCSPERLRVGRPLWRRHSFMVPA